MASLQSIHEPLAVTALSRGSEVTSCALRRKPLPCGFSCSLSHCSFQYHPVCTSCNFFFPPAPLDTCCISYFPQCCDKVLDQRKGLFCLTVWQCSPSWWRTECIAAGARGSWSHCAFSQEAERGHVDAPVFSFLRWDFLASGRDGAGWVSPLQMNFSGNPI